MKNHLPSLLFFLFCWVALPIELQAHEPNQSYIFLRVYQDSIGGYYEVTTEDIDKVFNFGFKRGDSFEKIKPYLPTIEKYLLERISISSSLGEHPITFQKVELNPAEELGDYLMYTFKLGNVPEIPESLTFQYDVIFEADPTHEGIQVNMYNWKAGIMEEEGIPMLSFRKNKTEGTLDLSDSSVWNGVRMMIESGVHHIWIGIDHILFILALILPSVVRRQRRDEKVVTFGISMNSLTNFSGIWSPVESFKSAFIYLITIITFFTLAHSVTLSLAALEIVNLSSRLVESVIALSIALAAFHNIRPIFKADWVIAFVFGLFHGFGFASVLGDVGLVGEYMVWSLFGFNVGVELGQVAIIAIAFPILYFIRRSRFYPHILVYGSVLLIFVSLYWFVERAFEVDLPLGRILGL